MMSIRHIPFSGYPAVLHYKSSVSVINKPTQSYPLSSMQVYFGLSIGLRVSDGYVGTISHGIFGRWSSSRRQGQIAQKLHEKENIHPRLSRPRSHRYPLSRWAKLNVVVFVVCDGIPRRL